MPDDIGALMQQREQRRGGGGGRSRSRSNSTAALVEAAAGGREDAEKSLATLSSTELLNHQGEICMKDVVARPQEILALYASKTEMDKGEVVTLGQVQSQNQNIFLVVETTCPLAKVKAEREEGSDVGADILPPPPVLDMGEEEDAGGDGGGQHLSAERGRGGSGGGRASRNSGRNNRGDMELTEIPDWLENEFRDAEDIKYFINSLDPSLSLICFSKHYFLRRPNTGGRQSRNARDRNPRQQQKEKPPAKSKGSTSDLEYQKRLEQQFNQRQNEIRLEAQNAVRERERALNEEVVRLREELDRQRERQREGLEARAREEDPKGANSAACVVQ